MGSTLPIPEALEALMAPETLEAPNPPEASEEEGGSCFECDDRKFINGIVE
jgi:hypothetical protein